MLARALSRKVSFLSDPRHFPEASASVEPIETHFSWLFLTDHHVYKLKKPQRRVGMDYRSVPARLRGCREELRLNRRLARSVYLEVVPLALSDQGELHLGRGHRTVDWLVKMARLPSRYMLDEALAHRRITHRRLGVLAATLASFYATATHAPLGPAQYVRRIRSQVNRNKRSVASAHTATRELVDALAGRQLEFISREHASLGLRGARVVEAHGDLRPEHVCIAHPVCVIDCLEFNRDLRLLDPAEEIAFLALEVERLGHPGIAWDMVERYRRLAGDPICDSLVHFYMSHRAATRAMLAAMHLTDPAVVDRARWVSRTNSYLEDSCRHIQRALQPAPGRQSLPVNGHRVSNGATGFPSRMRRRA